MKVRQHIGINGKYNEYEICGESATHYFSADSNWNMQALPKDQFSPIPTDQWEDVSLQVETHGGQFISLPGLCVRIFNDHDDYRLVKEQLYRHGDAASWMKSIPVWAFRVERKR